jgi:hypothetical protein
VLKIVFLSGEIIKLKWKGGAKNILTVLCDTARHLMFIYCRDRSIIEKLIAL